MKRPSVFHNLYVVGSVDRALFERVKSVRSSCFRRYMYVSDLFSDVTYTVSDVSDVSDVSYFIHSEFNHFRRVDFNSCEFNHFKWFDFNDI